MRLSFMLPLLLQWTALGWREVLVDIGPKNQSQKLLRFVLAPAPTPASAAYTNLLPPPPLAEGEQGEVCPEGLVAVEELAMRVKESGGAALIADYGDMEIRRHTLRVSACHPLSCSTHHLLPSCNLVVVILSLGDLLFLQGFKQHQLHDVLEAPGTTDLTTDVNFGAFKRAAFSKGSLASFPGHSQILSHSRFSPQLQDKIWKGPGNEVTNVSAPV